MAWELVYFAHPTCSGSCRHCWSAGTYLGNPVPLDWHQRFWSQVDAAQLVRLRITGGEPFESPLIKGIISCICDSLDGRVPIIIHTSGRPFVSSNPGLDGIQSTLQSMVELGLARPGIQIHMSADEYHAETLYRKLNRNEKPQISSLYKNQQNRLSMTILSEMVKNVLGASDILKREYCHEFDGVRLKIHVADGRLNYHRAAFSFLSDEEWRNIVIHTEGLIPAGRALKLGASGSIGKRPDNSIFVIPGAQFSAANKSVDSERIWSTDSKESVFLESGGSNSKGAMIIGFVNLVERHFVGGTAKDALALVGKAT